MITIRLDVIVNTASLEQAGSRLPRAISDGIADTLKFAQGKQRGRMQDRFTIRRSPFLNQSVKITQFPRVDRLSGELAIAAPVSAPADRANVFGKFERGGLKKPRSGVSLAIPIVGSIIKPNKRSIVKPQYSPKVLLNSGNGISFPPGIFRVFLRGGARGSKVLLGEVAAKNRKGQGPRLPRARKGQASPDLREVRPLYLFVKQAPIKSSLDFVDGVSADIRSEWAPAFTKRWNAQLARASARARG